MRWKLHLEKKPHLQDFLMVLMQIICKATVTSTVEKPRNN